MKEIDTDKASYTLTHQLNTDQNGRTQESWIYRPKNSTWEMIKGKAGVDMIKKITSKFPKITIPFRHPGGDYPAVLNSATQMIGVDYHINREVFTLAGFVFFRRYNDDWNSAMHYGRGRIGDNYDENSLISWSAPCPTNFIYRLNNLLETKSCTEITHEEMKHLLNIL
jgi:hypothetical protein